VTRRPSVPPYPAKPRAVKGPGEGKLSKPSKPALHDRWAADPATDPAACLAFDVGSAATGYAVLTSRLAPLSFGVLRAPSGDEEKRTGRLIDAVLGVAREWPGVPVVVEICRGIRYGLKARSTDLATLARVQGRLAQSLIDAGRGVEMVADVAWTGAGGSKPKAERAAVIRLRMPAYADWAAKGHDPGLDCADALGLALYYLGKRATEDIVARGSRS
jgi:hypothetical protein